MEQISNNLRRDYLFFPFCFEMVDENRTLRKIEEYLRLEFEIKCAQYDSTSRQSPYQKSETLIERANRSFHRNRTDYFIIYVASVSHKSQLKFIDLLLL